MKILIAVPCMDQVAAGFAQSLAGLNKVGECSACFMVGSLIYESRNNIVKQALEMEADYIMWFDSDMIFEPDTLERLMKHIQDGKDIVSGLYFRRKKPFTPVLFKSLKYEENEASWEGYDDYPDTLFEVDGIGFGCVLMRTDILLDIGAKFGNYFAPIGGFGEDLSFCIRAKKCGYKIYVDPDVKLGHVAQTIIGEDFYAAIKGKR